MKSKEIKSNGNCKALFEQILFVGYRHDNFVTYLNIIKPLLLRSLPSPSRSENNFLDSTQY